MLNEDYFTIHPAVDRSRSCASTRDESPKNGYSIGQLASRELEDEAPENIADIATLMQVLKYCRIDREKMEAVEIFINNGGDELYYLRERMHDIMGLFIFQASRRLFLAHLLKIFNEASDEENRDFEGEKGQGPTRTRRRENLEAALQHADEEVRKLEFWSDVKELAENGETKGAADEAQGWDKTWAGIDDSGPKDVMSDQKLLGKSDCRGSKEDGTAISLGDEKGKGEAAETDGDTVAIGLGIGSLRAPRA